MLKQFANFLQTVNNHFFTFSQKYQKNQADQRPTTSRNARKQMSPNKSNKGSPWRKAGGKVRVFKKIIDDQAVSYLEKIITKFTNTYCSINS